MALIKCKECGQQVSTDAKTCPHCGTRSVTSSKLSMLLGILVLLGIIANFGSKDKSKPTNTSGDEIAVGTNGEKQEGESPSDIEDIENNGPKKGKCYKANIFN